MDFLFAYAAPPAYLPLHQGWAHSLVGAAGLGVLIAILFWRRARQHWRQGSGQPHLWLRLLVAAWLGVASHLLLDWTTAAGVTFFWPVRTTEYGLDWFARVDPWVLAVLLLGLAIPALFRLISEEIGARPGTRGVRRGAWAAVFLFLLFCGVRGFLHAQAVALLDAQTYRGRPPLRVGAFPTPANPFGWQGVVETDSTYEIVEVLLTGPERGTRMEFTYFKPSPSPALDAAGKSAVGRAFLASARFPLAEVVPIANGHRVVLRDLRFARASAWRHTHYAWIELDHRLQVVDAGFGLREYN